MATLFFISGKAIYHYLQINTIFFSFSCRVSWQMGIGNVTECVYVMVYGLGCMRVFHDEWIGMRFLQDLIGFFCHNFQFVLAFRRERMGFVNLALFFGILLVYVWANYHIILVITLRLLVNNIIKVNDLGTIHHCYCIRLYILGLVLVSNVNH